MSSKVASVAKDEDREERCSIARSLQLLGERWTLLIVREALRGATTYSDFRNRLGVPSDVLSTRLTRLTAEGVFEKVRYQPAGGRERHRYALTERGLSLKLVLAALLQWGDENRPSQFGQSAVVVDAVTGADLSLAFVEDDASGTSVDRVRIIPGPSARSIWDSL